MLKRFPSLQPRLFGRHLTRADLVGEDHLKPFHTHPNQIDFRDVEQTPGTQNCAPLAVMASLARNPRRHSQITNLFRLESTPDGYEVTISFPPRCGTESETVFRLSVDDVLNTPHLPMVAPARSNGQPVQDGKEVIWPQLLYAAISKYSTAVRLHLNVVSSCAFPAEWDWVITRLIPYSKAMQDILGGPRPALFLLSGMDDDQRLEGLLNNPHNRVTLFQTYDRTPAHNGAWDNFYSPGHAYTGVSVAPVNGVWG